MNLSNEERQALIDESRSEITRMKRILETGSVAIGWARAYEKEILRHEIVLSALTENWQERAQKAEAQLAELAKQEPAAQFYKSEHGNVFNTLEGWKPVEGVNELFTRAAPPAPVVDPGLLAQFNRHRLLQIIVTGPDASGAEQNTLARIALAFYPKETSGSVADDDTDDKRRAFIDSLADDTAPQQYESLSTGGYETEVFTFADGRQVELPTLKKSDK